MIGGVEEIKKKNSNFLYFFSHYPPFTNDHLKG